MDCDDVDAKLFLNCFNNGDNQWSVGYFKNYKANKKLQII